MSKTYVDGLEINDYKRSNCKFLKGDIVRNKNHPLEEIWITEIDYVNCTFSGIKIAGEKKYGDIGDVFNNFFEKYEKTGLHMDVKTTLTKMYENMMDEVK